MRPAPFSRKVQVFLLFLHFNSIFTIIHIINIFHLMRINRFSFRRCMESVPALSLLVLTAIRFISGTFQLPYLTGDLCVFVMIWSLIVSFPVKSKVRRYLASIYSTAYVLFCLVVSLGLFTLPFQPTLLFLCMLYLCQSVLCRIIYKKKVANVYKVHKEQAGRLNLLANEISKSMSESDCISALLLWVLMDLTDISSQLVWILFLFLVLSMLVLSARRYHNMTRSSDPEPVDGKHDFTFSVRPAGKPVEASGEQSVTESIEASVKRIVGKVLVLNPRYENLHRSGKELESSLKKVACRDAEKKLYLRCVEYLTVTQMYLSHQCGLEWLSQELGTNKSYLSKAINKCSNANFNTFIAYFRCETAMEFWLKNPAAKIVEIVAMSGFNNTESFGNSSQALYGMSPSEIRKVYQDAFQMERIRRADKNLQG